MKRILTGLQPTGVITLGNYIGAIKPMKERQDEYESFIFVADLHAITVSQDPKEFQKNRLSLVALYLACGIDPKKNHIFLQSENEYHANISWLLECNTYYGELSRMTQFKDKSKKNTNFTSGLLTYPVLMAADILAYDIDYVPVGGDQKQHVELARDIAERFNKKYGEIFKLPEPLISKSGTKIYDLQDPTKKMSKSSENEKGVIRLLDPLDVVRKKIMSATTDSEMCVKYDPDKKPGISNLINIYASLTNKSISDIEYEFNDANYGTFKTKVADVVVSVISDIQEKYNKLYGSKKIEKILNDGLKKVRPYSKNKYEQMKQIMGFGREYKPVNHLMNFNNEMVNNNIDDIDSNLIFGEYSYECIERALADKEYRDRFIKLIKDRNDERIAERYVNMVLEKKDSILLFKILSKNMYYSLDKERFLSDYYNNEELKKDYCKNEISREIRFNIDKNRRNYFDTLSDVLKFK